MRNSLPMLIALAALLGACATPSTSLLAPSVVAPPKRPPLPPSARQPTMPPECAPSCSAALTSERESWRLLLTVPTQPGSGASAPTR